MIPGGRERDAESAWNRLRESEQRFRNLVESVRDYAIFLIDRHGRVLTWNTGAELIKGYRAEEVIGKSIDTFYTQEARDAGRVETLLAKAIEDGRIEEEGWRVRKDGTRFWADVVITALHDADGEVYGFAKVTRDLTERRELMKAQEAVRLRDEFLSIASHELRTPLTALLLQLESIRNRISQIDERSAVRLDKALGAGRRLAELVESLMDVGRIAAGKFTLSPSQFELGEVVCSAVESMRVSAMAVNTELHCHTASPIEGAWDRLRVEQIVMNLVSNAIKYGAGKPVDITVEPDGDGAAIRVRDHGPGVHPGDADRIFGRFERAASTRHYGGLGLGLYVTRQIAEAHGGHASVENCPDGGARFTVWLPIH